MLLTGCAQGLKPVKPEPCNVWALPPKIEVSDKDILVLQDNAGKEWVALSAEVAAWIDTYMGSVDRQQLLLSTCPYVKFNTLGGAEALRAVNWDKVNLEVGRIGGR